MDDETTTIEEDRMMQLEETRATEWKISAEKLVTGLAQRAAGKLNQFIAQGHDTTAFSIAILLASIKDGVDIGLDFTIIGGIPIVGQLPGMFISATLMYFLWSKGYFNRTKVKILLWGLGFFVDNLPIPFFNALPMTVFTVLMAWHVVRTRAKKAEKELEELYEMTDEQLTVIEQEN